MLSNSVNGAAISCPTPFFPRPLEIDDGFTHFNVKYGSAIIAKLNIDIETLTTSMDRIEAADLKLLVESAIAILTLARVRSLLVISSL